MASPLEGADGNGAPFKPYPKPNNTRKAKPFADFEAELRKRNAMLKDLREPAVLREEFFGARLYTGPVRTHLTAPLESPHTVSMPLPTDVPKV